MRNGMMLGCFIAAMTLVSVGALESSKAEAASPREAVQSELVGAVPSSAIHQAITDETLAIPKFKAHMQWDAGATGVSQVIAVGGINQVVQFEPVTTAAFPNGVAFCFKSCPTATCVPDCTKDFVLNQPTVTYQSPDGGSAFTGYAISNPPRPMEPYPMGQDVYIVVSSLDAGDPNVNLFTLTRNPAL